MKKILVPTDLSDVAELGLRLAVEIAKRCHASISMVNFTQHPISKSFTTTGDVNLKIDGEEDVFTLRLLHAQKEKLEALVALYSAAGVAIEFSVLDNDFENGIDDYLEQEKIDLVVMGTSGEETAKEVFTGNHTEKVIKVSSCPVLSVRDGFKVEDLNNIVAAVDIISDNQVAHGLSILRELASCFDAHIHVVHVRDSDSDSNLILDEYFTRMAEIAELPNYTVRILEGEDHADGVIQYSKEVKAGLIAVIKNSKDGIFRIFSNHFSDRLVKEVGKPVFTYNLQNT
jgi:nucleotide-binding universal stress UspA family protein